MAEPVQEHKSKRIIKKYPRNYYNFRIWQCQRGHNGIVQAPRVARESHVTEGLRVATWTAGLGESVRLRVGSVGDWAGSTPSVLGQVWLEWGVVLVSLLLV